VKEDTMGKKPIHTVPHGDGWANRREGSQRVTETFDTQAEAAAAAREAALREGTEHFIHRPNGQIRERNSYGNDPYPPEG
jgi:hypothetical protein